MRLHTGSRKGLKMFRLHDKRGGISRNAIMLFIVLAISLALLIFSQALKDTDVELVSMDIKGETVKMVCKISDDDYKGKLLYVNAKMKDKYKKYRKGDPLIVYSFKSIKSESGVLKVDAFRVETGDDYEEHDD